MINDKKYFYFFTFSITSQGPDLKMINDKKFSHFQLRVRGQCKIRFVQFTSVMLCTALIRACPTTLIFLFAHCHISEKNLGHVSEKVLSQPHVKTKNIIVATSLKPISATCQNQKYYCGHIPDTNLGHLSAK